MSDLSWIVTNAGNGRARFLVQNRGTWQDGDIGLRPEWMKVCDGFFTGFTESLKNNRPLTIKYIHAQCEALFKTVLPDATQNILSDTLDDTHGDRIPTLRIYSDPVFDHVPWELLRDDTDFLGVRCRIARMPIMSDPPSHADHKRMVRDIYHVLGKGVMALPDEGALLSAWRKTFDPLPSQAYPSSGEQPVWPDLDVLEKAWFGDILHITCHGLDKAAGWTLDKDAGEPGVINDTIVDTLKIRDGRPLVFANACSSVGSATVLTPGLAPKFISRGTLNLIGTFAPVTRDLAIRFAVRFYSLLLGTNGSGPAPIAEALRLTKKQFQDDAAKLAPGAAYDPSYLFYCLYGPPDSCFERAPAAAANGGAS